MRLLITLPLALLLSGLLSAFGQAHPVPATSNAAWLDSVQRLPLPQQVAAVQARAWRAVGFLRATHVPDNTAHNGTSFPAFGSR